MAGALEPESTLGPYRIKNLLGKGGMGEVYLAEDTRLSRNVALKVLPAKFTSDPDRVARFTQEAKAASALNHPNIVTIHEIGDAGGMRYISTEFIDGETLRKRLEHGKTALQEGLDIAIQAAGALAVAHQAGIVHRDIKPDNIMLRRDGYVKILDFGLAKLTERTPSSQPLSQEDETAVMDHVDTQAGVVMGTAYYMSPEQARGLPIDARSDVYSLGATLYEMFTGKPPFQGGSMPREVAGIVDKALAQDREERYQTIADLAADLKRTRRQLDNVAPAAAARKVPAAVWIALAAGVLAAGATALYRWQPWRGRPPFEHFRLTSLTNTGKAHGPAISPDGRYVVYEECDRGKCGLWLRQMAAASNIAIVPAGSGNYRNLSFSDDGNFIYFIHAGWLCEMPALGGEIRRIVDHVRLSAVQGGRKKAIVIPDTGTNEVSDFNEINLDGSGRKKLFTKRAPDFVIEVEYAGDSVAYSTQRFTGNGVKTFIQERDPSGSERDLSRRTWLHVAGFAPLERGGLLVAGFDPGATFQNQVWRVDSAGEASRITNDLANYTGLSVSRDGKTMALSRLDIRATLWSVNPGKSDSAHQITTAESRRDGSFGEPGAIAILPNGSLVFDGLSENSIKLWMCDRDGGNARPLSGQSWAQVAPQATASGETLVYVSPGANVNPELWAADRDGRNARQLTHGSGAVQFSLAANSDIIYHEIGKKGFQHITLKGDPPVTIDFTDVAFYESFALSPDGQTIAFVFEDEAEHKRHRIGYIPITGGKRIRTGDIIQDQPEHLSWTADGKAIVYTVQSGTVTRIVKQPVEGGEPSTLVEVPNDTVFSYGLSADGTQLVYSRGVISNDIVLMTDEK